MRNENSFDGAFCVVKGAGLALVLSLLSAVVFAVILQCTGGGERMVYPVSQILKCVCLCTGALVCVRGEKGWLKGMGVALVFTALSYLGFSALGGDFSLSWLILAEVGLSLGVGALGGIVAVNFK